MRQLVGKIVATNSKTAIFIYRQLGWNRNEWYILKKEAELEDGTPVQPLVPPGQKTPTAFQSPITDEIFQVDPAALDQLLSKPLPSTISSSW